MRVIEAARMISTGRMTVESLWEIATPRERIMVALLLGHPDWLPQQTRTPNAVWNALDSRQRDLLLRRAPRRIRASLPGYVSTSAAPSSLVG